ncbi:MAG: hypothetical protein ACK4QW_16560 [Alphaproteobacteria bacterium]
MPTSNTLLAPVLGFIERNRLGRDDAVFMASPLAHQSGLSLLRTPSGKIEKFRLREAAAPAGAVHAPSR